MPLEIAAFSLASALQAARAGAHRIELCTSYPLGGVTPSLPTLRALLHALRAEKLSPRVKVHVMIRPRGGDFAYSAAEVAGMRCCIEEFCGEEGVDGFVFGVLTARGEVDRDANRGLVGAAGGRACVFHRAIDCVEGIEGAVRAVVECGFSGVLTSGGGATAEEGWEVVRGVQGRFGERVEVVLGGGVRRGNVERLKRAAGVRWVHSAAITGEGEEVDVEEVKAMVGLLRDMEEQG